MSAITIAWSMCAAACLMLGLLHALLWLNDRGRTVYLLSVLMSIGAAGTAICELALMHADTVERYRSMFTWINPSVYTLLVPMVWFVHVYLGTARRWLAVSITALWTTAITVDMLSPTGITFAEIDALRFVTTFWGETFALPVGTASAWKILPDAASVLIALYVVDASVRAWRNGRRRAAAVVGGSITLFNVAAGIHTPLVDAGLPTPYVIGFWFLAIVLALSHELVGEAVRAARLAREVEANERRWRALMEDVHLAVLGVDTGGRVNYVNPFVLELTGYAREDLIGRPVSQLVPGADGGAPLELFDAAAVRLPGVSGEWALTCSDGTTRHVHWSPVHLVEPDGRPAGVLGIGADVTAEREAEFARDRALGEVEALTRRLEEENVYLKEEISHERGFDDIVGDSDAMQDVRMKIGRVAGTGATVLIEGETGVGKELVARAVHDASDRRDGPFVRVNCAVLPENLVDSELFGHERGAFTGAIRQRKGRFELADGGTLFLDEVGELPAETQGKLLRVLQEGEFERLGGSQTLSVDVRIIAATNRTLADEIEAGRFREDLFYRLNVYPITIPPLRERDGDVGLLVRHCVRRIGERLGKEISEIPRPVMAALEAYSWPGNVRELENVIERALITTPDQILRLPATLGGNVEAAPAAGPVSMAPLREMEADHIRRALDLTGGRISGPKGAARLLGMNPSTLRSRVAKLGLTPGARRGEITAAKDDSTA